MSRETIEVVHCDICGREIDIKGDCVRFNSILSGGYTHVPVHFHNPSYVEGYQVGITGEELDLCPECADRACALHLEVIPTEDGRSCHYVYSWRDECNTA